MSKSNFIAIAGNMGVGKTTLTRHLESKLGWTPFYESQERNPYIEDFYEDMRRWAFQSQIFFLTQRFQDHIRIQESSEICIQDRTIYEDAEIFATNLFERKLMPERDYRSYFALYEAMSRSLQKPDIIVYLKASTWTLISRIRKRGRDYEKDIDREYLAQLNISYDRWVRKITQSLNVMTVDTDNYDMETDANWRDSIIDEIKEQVK